MNLVVYKNMRGDNDAAASSSIHDLQTLSRQHEVLYSHQLRLRCGSSQRSGVAASPLYARLKTQKPYCDR
jgi:hypothetical protein